MIDLFRTEMLAEQLFPETVGEWRGIGKTPPEEALVDRDRLAEIVTGSG
jgi:iron complex transport system substrate-binding protein